MTTFQNQNPSFRIFEMDEETLLPIKASTYYMDLTKKKPTWELYMEYTDEYNMPDLSPQSFSALSDTLLHDPKVAH
jgi:sphingomyelin phosphodiesterase